MAELAVGVGPLPSASAWRRALRHPSFAIGGVLVLLLLATAALSWVWTPHAATEIDIAHRLELPSARHWLGTDGFGRDVASLLIVGARNSIAVGIVAVGIAVSGSPAGGAPHARDRPIPRRRRPSRPVRELRP